MINEEAVQYLGFKNSGDAIGHFITDIRNNSMQIIGTVPDFHQESLRRPIRPLVLVYQQPANFGQYSVLFKSNYFKEAMSFIENKWKLIYPDAPFNYNFLDQQLDDLYISEIRFGYLLLTFAVLAIFISCLGLLGLIMILTRKNIKQIGIRKINGAKVSQIMIMLNKDFLQWVGLAVVIASPIAAYLMFLWLNGFAYKTNLSWWIFVMSGTITLVIALLTVSWQGWKAATQNPVEAIKYE
jgi:putative ABC transport system permease protein